MVPIDKARGDIALIYKQFYASVIANELELGLRNTNTYRGINYTSKDEIIIINIEDLQSNFGINNVLMDSHCLPNMHWLPKNA